MIPVIYSEQYKDQLIDMILAIQQIEFGVAVTRQDQPDLEMIPEFYQQRNGNFWITLKEEEVIGSIALIDIGNDEGALRKMFVKKEYRGKESGVAQQLLETLLNWARSRNMKTIYLGTTDVLKASHRFYEKNNFARIPKEDLPGQFPRMEVDTMFYVIRL
jgi:N-acetylglutamate synthase-like GNAT family acetyltransferase